MPPTVEFTKGVEPEPVDKGTRYRLPLRVTNPYLGGRIVLRVRVAIDGADAGTHDVPGGTATPQIDIVLDPVIPAGHAEKVCNITIVAVNGATVDGKDAISVRVTERRLTFDAHPIRFGGAPVANNKALEIYKKYRIHFRLTVKCSLAIPFTLKCDALNDNSELAFTFPANQTTHDEEVFFEWGDDADVNATIEIAAGSRNHCKFDPADAFAIKVPLPEVRVAPPAQPTALELAKVNDWSVTLGYPNSSDTPVKIEATYAGAPDPKPSVAFAKGEGGTAKKISFSFDDSFDDNVVFDADDSYWVKPRQLAAKTALPVLSFGPITLNGAPVNLPAALDLGKEYVVKARLSYKNHFTADWEVALACTGLDNVRTTGNIAPGQDSCDIRMTLRVPFAAERLKLTADLLADADHPQTVTGPLPKAKLPANAITLDGGALNLQTESLQLDRPYRVRVELNCPNPKEEVKVRVKCDDLLDRPVEVAIPRGQTAGVANITFTKPKDPGQLELEVVQHCTVDPAKLAVKVLVPRVRFDPLPLVETANPSLRTIKSLKCYTDYKAKLKLSYPRPGKQVRCKIRGSALTNAPATEIVVTFAAGATEVESQAFKVVNAATGEQQLELDTVAADECVPADDPPPPPPPKSSTAPTPSPPPPVKTCKVTIPFPKVLFEGTLPPDGPFEIEQKVQMNVKLASPAPKDGAEAKIECDVFDPVTVRWKQGEIEPDLQPNEKVEATIKTPQPGRRKLTVTAVTACTAEKPPAAQPDAPPGRDWLIERELMATPLKIDFDPACLLKDGKPATYHVSDEIAVKLKLDRRSLKAITADVKCDAFVGAPANSKKYPVTFAIGEIEKEVRVKIADRAPDPNRATPDKIELENFGQNRAVAGTTQPTLDLDVKPIKVSWHARWPVRPPKEEGFVSKSTIHFGVALSEPAPAEGLKFKITTTGGNILTAVRPEDKRDNPNATNALMITVARDEFFRDLPVQIEGTTDTEYAFTIEREKNCEPGPSPTLRIKCRPKPTIKLASKRKPAVEPAGELHPGDLITVNVSIDSPGAWSRGGSVPAPVEGCLFKVTCPAFELINGQAEVKSRIAGGEMEAAVVARIKHDAAEQSYDITLAADVAGENLVPPVYAFCQASATTSEKTKSVVVKLKEDKYAAFDAAVANTVEATTYDADAPQTVNLKVFLAKKDGTAFVPSTLNKVKPNTRVRLRSSAFGGRIYSAAIGENAVVEIPVRFVLGLNENPVTTIQEIYLEGLSECRSLLANHAARTVSAFPWNKLRVKVKSGAGGAVQQCPVTGATRPTPAVPCECEAIAIVENHGEDNPVRAERLENGVWKVQGQAANPLMVIAAEQGADIPPEAKKYHLAKLDLVVKEFQRGEDEPMHLCDNHPLVTIREIKKSGTKILVRELTGAEVRSAIQNKQPIHTFGVHQDDPPAIFKKIRTGDFSPPVSFPLRQTWIACRNFTPEVRRYEVEVETCGHNRGPLVHRSLIEVFPSDEFCMKLTVKPLPPLGMNVAGSCIANDGTYKRKDDTMTSRDAWVAQYGAVAAGDQWFRYQGSDPSKGANPGTEPDGGTIAARSSTPGSSRDAVAERRDKAKDDRDKAGGSTVRPGAVRGGHPRLKFVTSTIQRRLDHQHAVGNFAANTAIVSHVELMRDGDMPIQRRVTLQALPPAFRPDEKVSGAMTLALDLGAPAGHRQLTLNARRGSFAVGENLRSETLLRTQGTIQLRMAVSSLRNGTAANFMGQTIEGLTSHATGTVRKVDGKKIWVEPAALSNFRASEKIKVRGGTLEAKASVGSTFQAGETIELEGATANAAEVRVSSTALGHFILKYATATTAFAATGWVVGRTTGARVQIAAGPNHENHTTARVERVSTDNNTLWVSNVVVTGNEPAFKQGIVLRGSITHGIRSLHTKATAAANLAPDTLQVGEDVRGEESGNTGTIVTLNPFVISKPNGPFKAGEFTVGQTTGARRKLAAANHSTAKKSVFRKADGQNIWLDSTTADPADFVNNDDIWGWETGVTAKVNTNPAPTFDAAHEEEVEGETSHHTGKVLSMTPLVVIQSTGGFQANEWVFGKGAGGARVKLRSDHDGSSRKTATIVAAPAGSTHLVLRDSTGDWTLNEDFGTAAGVNPPVRAEVRCFRAPFAAGEKLKWIDPVNPALKGDKATIVSIERNPDRPSIEIKDPTGPFAAGGWVEGTTTGARVQLPATDHIINYIALVREAAVLGNPIPKTTVELERIRTDHDRAVATALAALPPQAPPVEEYKIHVAKNSGKLNVGVPNNLELDVRAGELVEWDADGVPTGCWAAVPHIETKRRTFAQISALTPLPKDVYVVRDAGRLAAGTLEVLEGDLVQWKVPPPNGPGVWVKVPPIRPGDLKDLADGDRFRVDGDGRIGALEVKDKDAVQWKGAPASAWQKLEARRPVEINVQKPKDGDVHLITAPGNIAGTPAASGDYWRYAAGWKKVTALTVRDLNALAPRDGYIYLVTQAGQVTLKPGTNENVRRGDFLRYHKPGAAAGEWVVVPKHTIAEIIAGHPLVAAVLLKITDAGTIQWGGNSLAVLAGDVVKWNGTTTWATIERKTCEDLNTRSVTRDRFVLTTSGTLRSGNVAVAAGDVVNGLVPSSGAATWQKIPVDGTLTVASFNKLAHTPPAKPIYVTSDAGTLYMPGRPPFEASGASLIELDGTLWKRPGTKAAVAASDFENIPPRDQAVFIVAPPVTLRGETAVTALQVGGLTPAPGTLVEWSVASGYVWTARPVTADDDGIPATAIGTPAPADKTAYVISRPGKVREGKHLVGPGNYRFDVAATDVVEYESALQRWEKAPVEPRKAAEIASLPPKRDEVYRASVTGRIPAANADTDEDTLVGYNTGTSVWEAAKYAQKRPSGPAPLPGQPQTVFWDGADQDKLEAVLVEGLKVEELNDTPPQEGAQLTLLDEGPLHPADPHGKKFDVGDEVAYTPAAGAVLAKWDIAAPAPPEPEEGDQESQFAFGYVRQTEQRRRELGQDGRLPLTLTDRPSSRVFHPRTLDTALTENWQYQGTVTEARTTVGPDGAPATTRTDVTDQRNNEFEANQWIVPDFITQRVNFSLTRNGEEDETFASLRKTVYAILYMAQHFQDFADQFKRWPSIGWSVTFSLAFLEGDFMWRWGWKEHTDYQAFYWEQLQIALTVIRLSFRIDFGFRWAFFGLKFEAMFYALLTAEFQYHAQCEVTQPKGKFANAENWFSIPFKCQVGFNMVILNDNFLACGAAIRTGFELRIRILQKPGGSEKELYGLGVSCILSINIINWYKRDKEYVWVEGSPPGIPWKRWISPQSGGNDLWRVRMKYNRIARKLLWDKAAIEEAQSRLHETMVDVLAWRAHPDPAAATPCTTCAAIQQPWPKANSPDEAGWNEQWAVFKAHFDLETHRVVKHSYWLGRQPHRGRAPLKDHLNRLAVAKLARCEAEIRKKMLHLDHALGRCRALDATVSAAEEQGDETESTLRAVATELDEVDEVAKKARNGDKQHQDPHEQSSVADVVKLVNKWCSAIRHYTELRRHWLDRAKKKAKKKGTP